MTYDVRILTKKNFVNLKSEILALWHTLPGNSDTQFKWAVKQQNNRYIGVFHEDKLVGIMLTSVVVCSRENVLVFADVGVLDTHNETDCLKMMVDFCTSNMSVLKCSRLLLIDRRDEVKKAFANLNTR